MKSQDLKVGKIYLHGHDILKCTKVRESGVHTFQLVDDNGEPIIVRDEKHQGIILDRGVRIVSQSIGELIEWELPKKDIFCFMTGSSDPCGFSA